MNLESFIKQLTKEGDDKLNFNEIDSITFDEFVETFDTLRDNDKEFYLLQIIESTSEKELLTGNFEKWFAKENISDVLRSAV